jgi:hypothetical protein
MSATTSQLAVANEALAELKQLEGITSISDQTGDSPEQRYVARFLPPARLTVLRAHDWPFARKRLCIAACYCPETFAWSVAIPSDCVRVLALTLAGCPVSFERIGANLVLLSDADEMLYTEDMQDIDLWDHLARQALVMKLTARLAEPISGRLNAWEKYENMYNRTLTEARIAAGREAHRHYGTRKNGSPHYPQAMLGSPEAQTRTETERFIP